MSDRTAISVIMATWNNARRLSVTLDAIAECHVPAGLRWELVLVNNNCTDDTAVVARRRDGRLPLIYREEPRQGLSHARNTGLRSATGAFIIFTDDDVRPCSDWIHVYWSAFRERPDGHYFGGRLVPEFESGPPPPELIQFASLPITGLDWGREPRRLGPDERFLGANWGCPATALRGAGDFDTRLGLDASLGRRRVGEEWDLMERLSAVGFEGWYLPRAVVRHFVPAHKSRLHYIADNWEAHGHYASLRSAHVTPFLRHRPHLRPAVTESGRRVAGVPWQAYREAARFGLRWVLAGTVGVNDYAAYLSWRFARGAIRGHRERRLEQRQPAASRRGA